MNLLFALLVFYELLNFSFTKNRVSDPDFIFDRKQNEKPALSHVSLADSLKPDIFYIVFDGYTSSSALKKVWNFDNHDLDSFLISKGFYIAEHSTSNYNYTPYSIASTLSMSYLKKSAINKRDDPVWTLRAIRACKENTLFDFLKRENYSIRTCTNFTDEGDSISISPYFTNLAENQVLFQTYPGRIKRDWGWVFEKGLIYLKKSNKYEPIERYNKSVVLETKYQINLLKNICDTNPLRPPNFVYTHFMLLHYPYVFDKNGNYKNIDSHLANTGSNKQAYLDQVSYANKIIHDVVSTIIDSNKKNTIIILQGDHGSQYLNDKKYNYFENLSAFSFPNENYTGLSLDFSNVNTFRVVLNEYFKQDLPKLKKDSYNITSEVP